MTHRIPQWMLMEHWVGIMEETVCGEGVQRLIKDRLFLQGAYIEVGGIVMYKKISMLEFLELEDPLKTWKLVELKILGAW